MAIEFYRKDVDGKSPEGESVVFKDVLHIRDIDGQGFDGAATDAHKESFPSELAAFLASETPEAVAEAKAKLIAAKEKELEALKGEGTK